MDYTQDLFMLIGASFETTQVKSNIQMAAPTISRVMQRETDGSVYVIRQDVTIRFTIAVYPPGNQNDNGTTNEDAEGAILKIVERFNLDVWNGMIKDPNNENWLSGFAAKDDVRVTAVVPTAKDIILP